MTSREALISETFVTLTDTLVNGFDVSEMLHVLATTCVELLDADAAGIVLADRDGTLRVVGASHERLRLLELFEVQNDEGPCMDCFRSGEPVSEPDLESTSRWPGFTPRALDAGFRSAEAVPLRLRDEVIGALNLLGQQPGGLSEDQLRLSRALADVAAISLVQHRLLLESQLIAEQLQQALNSRVLIEQAKGMLAEQGSLDVDEAFELLRGHARSHNLPLSDLARDVVAGRTSATQLDRA